MGFIDDVFRPRCFCIAEEYLESVNAGGVKLVNGCRLLTFAKWVESNIIMSRKKCYKVEEWCQACGGLFAWAENTRTCIHRFVD